MAIVSVVMEHAAESYYYAPLVVRSEAISSGSLYAGILLFTFGRIGVPLFLMLTGYLLLGREYDSVGVGRFWRSRWVPLFCCSATWLVLYQAML